MRETLELRGEFSAQSQLSLYEYLHLYTNGFMRFFCNFKTIIREVEELTKVLSDLVRENRELEVRSVMVIRVIEFQAVGAKLEIFLP